MRALPAISNLTINGLAPNGASVSLSQLGARIPDRTPAQLAAALRQNNGARFLSETTQAGLGTVISLEHPRIESYLLRAGATDLNLVTTQGAADRLRLPSGIIASATKGHQALFYDKALRPAFPLTEVAGMRAVRAASLSKTGIVKLATVGRATGLPAVAALLVPIGAIAASRFAGSNLDPARNRTAARVGVLGGGAIVAMTAGSSVGIMARGMHAAAPTRAIESLTHASFGIAAGGALLGAFALWTNHLATSANDQRAQTAGAGTQPHNAPTSTGASK